MSTTTMEVDGKAMKADFQKEAKRLMEYLLLSDPDNYIANYGKSLLLFNDGQLTEASQFISKAFTAAPDGGEFEIAAMKKKIDNILQPSIVAVEASTTVKAAVKKEQISPPPVKSAVIDAITGQPVSIQLRDPSPPKQHRCEICNKTFSKQFSLNRHMLLHSGDKPFRCSLCDRGFVQRNDLERHEAVHSDELKFECTVPDCLKRFKSKKSLASHMVTHSDVRPFPCTICEKSFKAKKMLNFHMNLHTHANTFECPECDRKFPAKSYLKNHMKRHDTMRPFQCNQCTLAFKRECDLNNHTRNKHGKKVDAQQIEDIEMEVIN